MLRIVLKILCLAALVAFLGVLVVHLLPWLIALLVVAGLAKLCHSLIRPKNNLPTRWPWKE